MPGAADFVRAHRRQLATTSVAFFFTCLALSNPGGNAARSANQYEQKIRAIAPEIDPLGVGRFAGVLDYSRLTPVTRIFAHILDAARSRRWRPPELVPDPLMGERPDAISNPHLSGSHRSMCRDVPFALESAPREKRARR